MVEPHVTRADTMRLVLRDDGSPGEITNILEWSLPADSAKRARFVRKIVWETLLMPECHRLEILFLP